MSEENNNASQDKEPSKGEKYHSFAKDVVIPIATGLVTIAGILIKVWDNNKKEK